MSLLDLDIKTIVTLLVIGNLAQLIILVFYRNYPKHRRPYWYFTAGKMLQLLAWLLLSMRGSISVLLSAYVGNVLLFGGLACEVFSLTTVGRAEKNWGIIYGSIAGVGGMAFCGFAATPHLWVGYSSLTVMLLFMLAAAAMLFTLNSSPMRRIVGLFYGLAGLALAVRAWNGFFAGSEFSLMSRNLVQTLTFSATFLLLIVSGTGFLLLFKEQADRQISESELKYRTLVENANEAICIVQDEKIVFTNKKTCELLGLDEPQLIGRSFRDFVFRDDLAMVVSYYQNRGEIEDIPKTYQFRVINHSGKPIWVLNSATLVEYCGKKASIVLITNIDRLKSMEKERERMIGELQKALADVKTLSGMLPICSACKKIRNDQGYWEKIERYIADRSGAQFSHGICPECATKLYPGLFEEH